MVQQKRGGHLTWRRVAAVALVGMLPACASPTQPSVSGVKVVPPIGLGQTVPQVPGYDQIWQLTTALTGTTGSGCVPLPPTGTTQSGTMLAARTDTTAKFLYWAGNWPTDDVEYPTTLSPDGGFAGQTAVEPLIFPGCGDGQFQGTLVGHFSNDFRHVDATETWSYHFAAGNQSVTFTWSADR